MTKKFEAGQKVLHKPTGRVVTLEDVNDNPNYKEDDEYWAMGYGSYGSVEIDGPQDIEPSDAKVPTKAELAAYVSSALHSAWGEDITISESGVEDGADVTASGSKGGVDFSVRIRILDVWEDGGW